MRLYIVSGILLIWASIAFCEVTSAQPETAATEKNAVGVALSFTPGNYSVGAVKRLIGDKKESVKKDSKPVNTKAVRYGKKENKQKSTGSSKNKLLRETILPDTHAAKQLVDTANSQGLKYQAFANRYPSVPRHSNLDTVKKFMQMVHPESKKGKLQYFGRQYIEKSDDSGDEYAHFEKEEDNQKVSKHETRQEEPGYGDHRRSSVKWDHRGLSTGRKRQQKDRTVKHYGGYGDEVVRLGKDRRDADEDGGRWKGEEYVDSDELAPKRSGRKHYSPRFQPRKSYGSRFTERKLSEDEISKYEGY